MEKYSGKIFGIGLKVDQGLEIQLLSLGNVKELVLVPITPEKDIPIIFGFDFRKLFIIPRVVLIFRSI